jgi:hypothetical protein
MSPRRNWDSPIPSLASECAPPPGWGVGGVPIPTTVPEIIDPVFAKTSPKRSFSITEYEHFGLVFTKTRVYKFGHWRKILALCLLCGMESIKHWWVNLFARTKDKIKTRTVWGVAGGCRVNWLPSRTLTPTSPAFQLSSAGTHAEQDTDIFSSSWDDLHSPCTLSVRGVFSLLRD